MAAHRYWRVTIAGNVYGSYGCIAEIAMATTAGGPNVLTGGTPIESGEYSSAYTASMAIDSDPSTYWLGGTGFPEWWGYDFGLGNAVAITEVRITPRNDGVPTTAPGNWTLDWSDDGSTWTVAAGFISAGWTNGVAQTFDTLPPGEYPYWRVLMQSPPAPGQNWGFAEIEMMAITTGPNLVTVPASASASSSYSSSYLPGAAVNEDLATGWVAASQNTDEWWGYNFGSPVGITQITITGDGFHGCPALGPVQYSADQIAWTTAWIITASAPWTTGTQTFDAPAPPPSSVLRPQAVIMG